MNPPPISRHFLQNLDLSDINALDYSGLSRLHKAAFTRSVVPSADLSSHVQSAFGESSPCSSALVWWP